MKRTSWILIGVLSLAGLMSAQSIEVLMTEAMAEFNAGDYSTAITKFRGILSREPSNFDAQLHLGVAYLRWDRPTNAVEELRKAMSLQPRNGEVWFFISQAYLELRNRTSASESILKTLQYDPNRAAEFPPMAKAYLKRGAYEQAQILYELIVSSFRLGAQEMADAHAALGWLALNKNRDPRAAVSHYAEATRLWGGHAPFWEGLALSHTAFGQKPEALAAWKRCLVETSNPQKREEIRLRIEELER